MHRNHDASHRTLADALALARARAIDAPAAAPLIPEPTLPSNTTVPKVTLTTDELHDLVYAAATSTLHRLSGMGREKARQHAGRIAGEADVIVHLEHTVYRADPA